jgi:hypothetical protein
LCKFPKYSQIPKFNLKFKKNFFLSLGPSPVFGPAAWALAFSWPASPPPLLGHRHQTATRPRPLAGPASPRHPRLPPSGKLAESRRSPRPDRPSSGRCPSPVPWREADLPHRLTLPLLYRPPLPPPLPVTGAHCHQCCRSFPAVDWCMSSLPHPREGTGSTPRQHRPSSLPPSLLS